MPKLSKFINEDMHSIAYILSKFLFPSKLILKYVRFYNEERN